MIDEVASLKAQATLLELMSQSREYGISVILGFQDVEQLQAIYGKEMTSSILNQPSTRLFLRSNDPETQAWCSRNIGRREVLRPVESETAGPENVRDSISRSFQRPEEAAVMGSQFGMLPNLSGYLKVAHYGAARVQIPYVGMVEHQPAFVERVDETSASKRELPEQRVVSRKRRML